MVSRIVGRFPAVVGRAPSVGQHLLVPWGLDEVDGEVVEVYELGGQTRVRVRVPILGPSDEELDSFVVALPLSAVRGYQE